MYGPAKKGMRLWAHFLPRLVQGFSRASLETRWKMSPSSFAAITGRGQGDKETMNKSKRITIGLSMALSCLMIVSPDELFAAKHKKKLARFAQVIFGQDEQSQDNGRQDAENRTETFDLFGRKKHERQRQENAQTVNVNDAASGNVDVASTRVDEDQASTAQSEEEMMMARRRAASATTGKKKDEKEVAAFLASLSDVEIRKLLHGESLYKNDKTVKMNTTDSGENVISPTRGNLIAALKDDAFRQRLLKEDKFYRDAAQTLGYCKAEKLSQKIRLSLEKNGFVPPPEERTGPGGPASALYTWQHELVMACNDIEKQDPSIWLKVVNSFDGDLEAKTFFIAYFIHDAGTDDADDAKKASANAQILASLPQKTLEQLFLAAAYWRKGIDTAEYGGNVYERNDYGFGFECIVGLPVIAKAIKDKEIIKHLLFDYDGWARYKKDSTRREMAYHALVDNIVDEDMIWQLYANTSPTKKCDVISVAYLSGLSAKLSSAKRKELTDAAFARANEFSKTNIVVKGYYLGMSLADFRLINAANGANGNIGEPATGIYDDATSRKMTKITFSRHYYTTFLGLNTGNPISDMEKFGREFGVVPDGIDVSGKTKISAAIRSKTDLEGHSSEGVWKWVDSYHRFQAEINDEEGTLTLCAPVEEGIFNKSDIRQEQANAVFDVFSGVDDDVDYYDN